MYRITEVTFMSNIISGVQVCWRDNSLCTFSIVFLLYSCVIHHPNRWTIWRIDSQSILKPAKECNSDTLATPYCIRSQPGVRLDSKCRNETQRCQVLTTIRYGTEHAHWSIGQEHLPCIYFDNSHTHTRSKTSDNDTALWSTLPKEGWVTTSY